MIKLNGNTIKIEGSRVLTPKQMFYISKLSERDQSRYLMSLMGLNKGSMYLAPRWDHKVDATDRLAQKRSGSILNILSTMRDLNRSHKPLETDLGEWIGVEIECIVPNEALDGGSAQSYIRDVLSDAKLSRTEVKYDGSLHDDDGEGVEVTMVFNSKRGFAPLETLCRVLSQAGCYVNKTCGLHVHLDCRQLDQKQVRNYGRKITRCLPVLKWIMPTSRHNNQYCQLAMSSFRGSRYFAVNLTSFRKFRTIEVRLHSGTIDSKKIINWIQILKSIKTAEVTSNLNTFQDLIDALQLSDKLVNYIETRINEVNPTAWSVLNPATQPEPAVAA